MYEFQYNYVKPKYSGKAKLYYMETDNFRFHVKTDDIYKDIAEDVKIRLDTSNNELEKPLPKGKNKKVICAMKDELGRKVMEEFVKLRAKTYSYFIRR